MSFLAHRGAADESLGVVLLFGAIWLGWVGWTRLRGRAFGRLPAFAGPALLVVAAGLVAASIVVPPALFPRMTPGTGPRPASTATVAFDQPEAGTTVTDGRLEVVVALRGGTIVERATSDLSPDRGHIHLSVDGRLVSMGYGVAQVVDVGDLSPGEHALRAEFVAADHGPFSPRVVATTTFRTEGTP